MTETPDSCRMQRSNSRSSKIGDPMRRSFSSNPFQKPSIVANPRGFYPITPANSPSDWAVRGRESNTMRFLRESEEKENGRDSNLKRTAAAKGVKNFMSPTISAASKINASPSKKILTERNHHEQQQQPPLRNSVSSLDLRSSCSSLSNLSETLEGSQIEAELERQDPSKVAFDSVTEPVDDADPLTPMPPYDPKTNYLAPRPKFLYYKPRQRIGSCLDAEMERNPLDGHGFFSDSLSEETTESDSSQIESEDVSSVTEEEVEAAVIETNFRSPEIEKEALRKHFLTQSKCILSVFILLIIACSAMVEMDDLRIRSYSMIKESSFPMVLEVVCREAEHVGQNLRVWCDDSVSYICRLVSELRGEGDRHFHITFVNLTYLDETQWNDKKKLYGNLIIEPNVQIVAEDIEGEESGAVIVAEVKEDEEDSVESESGGESEEPELSLVQSGGKVEEEEEEEVILIMEEEKIQEESEEKLPQIEKVISSSTDRIEVEVPSQDAAAETEVVPESIESSSFLKRMIQIASSVLALVTVAAAYVCLEKKTSSSVAVPNTVEEQNQAQEQPFAAAAKKFNISPVSGNPMTEFDVVGDSWPSEISSFHYKQPGKSSSSRRESLASSSSSSEMSMCGGGSVSPSPSYGSFTTYEIIPNKKRNGDDEELLKKIITPLRRSSRLRK